MEHMLRAVLIGAAIASCNPVSRPVDEEGSARRQTGDSLIVQRLDASAHFRSYGGLEEPARLVVRDAAEWERVWARLVKNHIPTPPTPVVDFDREVLIVAAMGTRGSGGYSIGVRTVVEGDGGLVATVVSSSPGPNCMTTQALTHPTDIVRVNRVGIPVRFIEESVVRDC